MWGIFYDYVKFESGVIRIGGGMMNTFFCSSISWCEQEFGKSFNPIFFIEQIHNNNCLMRHNRSRLNSFIISLFSYSLKRDPAFLHEQQWWGKTSCWRARSSGRRWLLVDGHLPRPVGLREREQVRQTQQRRRSGGKGEGEKQRWT